MEEIDLIVQSEKSGHSNIKGEFSKIIEMLIVFWRLRVLLQSYPVLSLSEADPVLKCYAN